jgi:hypothetical protein
MITLLFISCGSQKVKNDKAKLTEYYANAKGYSAVVSVTAPKLNYSFKFKRLKPDYSYIELVTPQNLKGLILETKGNESKIKYLGLEVPLDFMPFDIKRGIGQIQNIFCNLDKITELFNAKGTEQGMLTLNGKYENMDIEIAFNASLLMPLALKIGSGESTYEVKVESFEFIN